MDQLVSVLVLSYKNTQGIYPTIDSILMQDYPRIEIILSDDGTPGFPSDAEKILRYITEHKRNNIERFYINSLKENVGTVRNMNSGLGFCKGEFIKAISSEDTLNSCDAISKYVDFLLSTDFLIVFAKMRGITQNGEIKNELLACESDYDMLKKLNPKETANRLFKRNFLPAPAWMIRKALFERYGLFPEKSRLIEDYPYWITLSLQDVSFGYLDEVLIDYRLSGESSGGTYGKTFMNDMNIIYDNFIFPNDRRFGIFQKPYNAIKRSGLNFYTTLANWSELSTGARLWARIKYCHFFLYTWLQKKIINRKNRRIEKQMQHNS